MRAPASIERFIKNRVRARLLRDRFTAERFEYRAADTSTPPQPVLMCLWNRPSRLADVLRMLDEQEGVPQGVELMLWNNNKLDHEHYREVLRAASARGALRSVQLVRTPYNMGSIARFFLARRVAAGRGAVPVIVIDDDEDFEPDFVATALAHHDPHSIHAFWAFTVGDTYYYRIASEPGGAVDHIGPGGSVMSADIFLDDGFFTRIPEQYRMLDDLWLTWWAKQHGISLAKLPVEIAFVMDETNQYHGQTSMKEEFFLTLYPEKRRAGEGG